ncbi:MAG: hypothetical protein KJ043_11670, partial [Anaerolineae bacterium]|nr:hypothetical protein [Anaerolineae bacterium]
MRRLFFYVFFLNVILFSFTASYSQSSTPDPRYIRSDRLGIAHITITGLETPEWRYQQALALGAGWDRFPI